MLSRRHAVCLALLLIAPIAASADPASSAEYEVKAAFLYKFGNFAEIPSAPAGAPFVVTILGDDPFGGSLDATVEGKAIGGRRVRVRRTRDVTEAADSGIVFVSGSEKERVREILDALKTSKTLTVSDVDGFAAAGGMIGFVLDQNRIRFEINPGAAEQAGIRINAKLLALARIINTEK